MDTPKKSALGRGLGALIIDSQYENRKSTENASIDSINEIDINKIEVNPFQPRKEFDEELLQELSESIKELGIIQPITVRIFDGDKYQLISGERRLRASKLAGLTKIPAFIRATDDNAMLEVALVENIHREDLNPIELAISYKRLIEECNLTQENLGDKIKQKRSTIANYLRLLKLPAEIQIGLRDKRITMGHAKAIQAVYDPQKQIKLFFKTVNNGLSVRQTEELAKAYNLPEEERKKNEQSLPQTFADVTKSLKEMFSTNIELKRTESGKGKIIIPFKSDSDFRRILALLEVERNNSENISENNENNDDSNQQQENVNPDYNHENHNEQNY
jgi:ParB family transcriptional regulator, chromosome partitioning protein